MPARQLLSRLKAFIFDLDGVLVDSYYCWFHLLNDTLQKQGKAPLSIEDFDASWGQGVEADQQMFFPQWTVEEVIRFYNEHFADYTRWARPGRGALSLLQALKERSKGIAVASNSPNAVIANLLDTCGLSGYPDLFLGIEEVKEGKPAPDLIYAAIERLRVDIRDACYIG
ncbi:MAG TPA: HAD family phosphatase, partial [Acidobacteriota bacterium]